MTDGGATPICDECGSTFIAATSRMAALCPECAHCLYGTEPCAHTFAEGRCTRCGWNGSVSAYIASLKAPDSGG